jgi:hypothetical protein
MFQEGPSETVSCCATACSEAPVREEYIQEVLVVRNIAVSDRRSSLWRFAVLNLPGSTMGRLVYQTYDES